MRIRATATILSLICALPAGAQMRAFTGATIIDGNGGNPIQNGVVLIDGNTIKAVGRASARIHSEQCRADRRLRQIHRAGTDGR